MDKDDHVDRRTEPGLSLVQLQADLIRTSTVGGGDAQGHAEPRFRRWSGGGFALDDGARHVRDSLWIMTNDGRTASPTAVPANGQRREVREQDTALLYVLRNHLGLKGTRFGCGVGLCGACMVLVDGRTAYSCDTPLWSVLDKEITTVEGLRPADRPHPVTEALIAGLPSAATACPA